MKINKKILLASILFLVFSLNLVGFAGQGDGSGGGYNIPLALKSASIKNGETVESKPNIKLEFNKNVVNFKVRDNNKKSIKLYDSNNKAISTIIDMKDDQVEPDKRRDIYVSPKESLRDGKYILVVEKTLSSKSDMKLKEKVEINFNVGKTSDIDNHWAKKDIENLNKKGIMSGVGNGNFNPNGNITKGELSAIISRLLNLSKMDKSSNKEISNKWYENHMRKTIGAGIMEYGNGDKNLSREELVSYIGKSFEYKKLTRKTKSLSFKDNKKINKIYEKDIENMLAYGIVFGDEKGNFNPRSNITRGEVAVIINRTLKYLE